MAAQQLMELMKFNEIDFYRMPEHSTPEKSIVVAKQLPKIVGKNTPIKHPKPQKNRVKKSH
jgi:hypothetical protein